jgi:hypothetical protein
MSLFGAPAPTAGTFGTPAPTAGAFGAPAQTASGFGVFAPTTPASGTFGQWAQSQPNLLGAAHAQSQPSLFGASSAPAAGGFGAPVQSHPGLIGATPAQSQPNLFGAPVKTQPSLFGAVPAPSQPGSLFGAAPAQPQSNIFGQQEQGLFGNPATAPAYGQQQLQQQHQQQHQRHQQPPAVASSQTRVNQLGPKAIEMLESVERRLTEQRALASRLFSRQPRADEETHILRDRLAMARRTLVRTNTGVETLAANADALRHAIREERADADNVSSSLTQLARSQQQLTNDYRDVYPGIGGAYGGYGGTSYHQTQYTAPIPSSETHVSSAYFTAVVNDLEARANAYKREIDQIAEFLCAGGNTSKISSDSSLLALRSRFHHVTSAGVGGGAGGDMTSDVGSMDVADAYGNRHNRYRQQHGRSDSGVKISNESRSRAVEDIIRRQYEYFMVVASNVAAVHEGLARLKDAYVAEYRRSDPDAPDIFSKADARERAEQEKKRQIAAAIPAESLLRSASPSGGTATTRTVPGAQPSLGVVTGTTAAPAASSFTFGGSAPTLQLGAPPTQSQPAVGGFGLAPAVPGGIFGAPTAASGTLFGGTAFAAPSTARRTSGSGTRRSRLG